MSRRRGLVAGTALLAIVLTGCTDVAAEPSSSGTPSATGSSSSPTPSDTPSTPAPTATPTPTLTPTPGTTATPTPTPTAQPTVTPTTRPKPRPPAAYAKQVEEKLEAFGYPVGDVDGDITVRAQQALCAWRETNGLPISREGLTWTTSARCSTATKRPAPTGPAGIYVNKTCQVLYQIVDKQYKRIVWISTGAPGYDTPNRTGKVWRKWAGAHESSLYDDAYMYDSIYFLKDRPGIALHGSVSTR